MNLFKSKTINFNILIGAIFTVLTSFGIEIPAELPTAVLTIGNFVLRLITKEAIANK